MSPELAIKVLTDMAVEHAACTEEEVAETLSAHPDRAEACRALFVKVARYLPAVAFEMRLPEDPSGYLLALCRHVAWDYLQSDDPIDVWPLGPPEAGLLDSLTGGRSFNSVN